MTTSTVLRDHGIVDDYPQRWMISYTVINNEDDDDNDNGNGNDNDSSGNNDEQGIYVRIMKVINKKF